MRICSVDGCEKKYRRNGFCNMHAIRMKKHGSLEKPTKPRMYQQQCAFNGCQKNARTLGLCNNHYENKRLRGGEYSTPTSRFEGSVEMIPFSTCHWWTGYLNPKGYGETSRGLAHRVAYQMYVGEIPNGLLICHKCDNPACVNPDHLFTGTHQDNVNDMIQKGRAAWQSGPSRHLVGLMSL